MKINGYARVLNRNDVKVPYFFVPLYTDYTQKSGEINWRKRDTDAIIALLTNTYKCNIFIISFDSRKRLKRVLDGKPFEPDVVLESVWKIIYLHDTPVKHIGFRLSRWEKNTNKNLRKKNLGFFYLQTYTACWTLSHCCDLSFRTLRAQVVHHYRTMSFWSP